MNHPPLSFSVDLYRNSSISNTTPTYDFRRCNTDAVFAWIQDLPYPAISPSQAEQCFTDFCSGFADIIKYNSPMKSLKKSTFPKWFSAELRHMVIRKKKAHRHFKETGEPFFYNEFRLLRDQCKRLANGCYHNYINFLESTIPKNIKVFWSYIKNLKSTTPPSHLKYKNVEAEDPSLQCELFADFFSSVYSNTVLPGYSFDFGTNLNVSSLTFTAQQVERKLNTLDPNKGMGPDSIPAAVLRYCSSVLAPHLSTYFNLLLANGTFPANLKVIVDEQHGFRSGKSTSTNLILLQNYIISSFSNKHQVDCIMLDFSKAFDMINHGLLIAKLEGYGVAGSLLKWLSSYLTDRKMIVRFAGSFSGPFPVTSGVPQGSHLAPLLFNLFINDIYSVIASKYLMFADDIKLFLEVTSSRDCESLQETLERIEDWCSRNSMDLNVNKCSILTYSRSISITTFDYRLSGFPLSRVNKCKDLGVVLNCNLNPWDHITYVCKQSELSCGVFVQNIRANTGQGHKANWGANLAINTLTYLSSVFGFPWGCPFLKEEEEIADLVLLHKIINGLIDCPDLLS
ncbi:uncharacterized protein LOC124371611, partial [Homalodisca vitripennis]|uniref:uncharacterized protein LOC124371611 n=1 Tax=Homalodisca vitripennis TaxID=197043 RepID=UPI001EEB1AA4